MKESDDGEIEEITGKKKCSKDFKSLSVKCPSCGKPSYIKWSANKNYWLCL
jgi:hypothetical protein